MADEQNTPKVILLSQVPPYPAGRGFLLDDLHVLLDYPATVLLVSDVTEQVINDSWNALGFGGLLYFCQLPSEKGTRLLVGRQPEGGLPEQSLSRRQQVPKPGRRSLAAWGELKIGDSVVLQNTTAPSIYRSIRNFKLANEVVPYEFKVQKIGKKQYRAYRAA